MSDQRPRGLLRPRGKGPEDVPWLSREEVERRVDMRQRDPELEPEPAVDPAIDGGPTPDAEFDPGPAFNFDVLIGESDEPAVVTRTRVTPERQPAAERRRILWRDSATILVFVVLALLGAQLVLPRDIGGPSDSAIPSGINIGSLPPGVMLAPGMTLGPIVDPSLGIDATPTPIPAITLGPSQTPGPTPRPGRTPKPTVKPIPQPTPTPSPTPDISPTPSGNPMVSCDPPIGQTVTCTSSSSNIQAGTETGDMGGAGTFDTGGQGSSSVAYTYSDPGPFTATITLTVTGLDGVDRSASTLVDIGP